MVLMKSLEAEVTIDLLNSTCGDLRVTDYDTYYTVQRDGEIVVDMEQLGEELGRSITVSEWLVVLSSYVGRPCHEPTRFRVTTDLLQLT